MLSGLGKWAIFFYPEGFMDIITGKDASLINTGTEFTEAVVTSSKIWLPQNDLVDMLLDYFFDITIIVGVLKTTGDPNNWIFGGCT